MVHVCPVCDNNVTHIQRTIQCVNCEGLGHHHNQKNCSGLTDIEFNLHIRYLNSNINFECDKCLSNKTSGNFLYFPFSEDFDDVVNLDLVSLRTLMMSTQRWFLILNL